MMNSRPAQPWPSKPWPKCSTCHRPMSLNRQVPAQGETVSSFRCEECPARGAEAVVGPAGI